MKFIVYETQNRQTSTFLIIVFLMFMSCSIFGSFIDLNEFIADPSVMIATDGLSAVITENSEISHVILFNDPELIDIETDSILRFQYEFDESLGEFDEFSAFILNSGGASAGNEFEIFVNDTLSGIVSFDFSSLIDEQFIGLQFQLSSLIGDPGLESSVTISNVQVGQHIVTLQSSPVTGANLSGTLPGFTNYSLLARNNEEITRILPNWQFRV